MLTSEFGKKKILKYLLFCLFSNTTICPDFSPEARTLIPKVQVRMNKSLNHLSQASSKRLS
jgi:hypothetical protein